LKGNPPQDSGEHDVAFWQNQKEGISEEKVNQPRDLRLRFVLKAGAIVRGRDEIQSFGEVKTENCWIAG